MGLNLSDFDILGIITLNDVQGIEKYVTPLIQDGKRIGYLSRSKEYYNVKTMTELAVAREELKTKLTRELSKRNFVILENMINCSGKVYFKKFEQYIKSGKSEEALEELKRAEDCLNEDMQNILTILSNNGEIKLNPRNMSPTGEENSEKRAIEMDNKALLYLFAKAIKMNKKPSELEVVTPGYGSLYIGPMLKAMYGYDYTNILKSKYIEEALQIPDIPITRLMSSDRIGRESGKDVLLLDDNIGTGVTMREVKEKLEEEGIRTIMSGAVQYNWRNYYRIAIGEKKDIERFNVDDFDLLSPLNYAGHKLYKRAIDLLHSSGEEYVKYLQSKSYRKEGIDDIAGALHRGIFFSRLSGLELADGYDVEERNGYEECELLDEYKQESREITNPISRTIIARMIKSVEENRKQQTGDGR